MIAGFWDMNQRDQITDELLSAYLDGELSGQEQEQVERLLAEDPSHRQTLDELRSLSGDMQSLTRFQLGDDFYRRVVAIAEQAESESSAVAHAAALPGDASSRDETASAGWSGMGRPIAYAILALAAAVLIMIATRPAPQSGPVPGPQDVAHGDSPASVVRDPGALVAPDDDVPDGEGLANTVDRSPDSTSVVAASNVADAGMPARDPNSPQTPDSHLDNPSRARLDSTAATVPRERNPDVLVVGNDSPAVKVSPRSADANTVPDANAGVVARNVPPAAARIPGQPGQAAPVVGAQVGDGLIQYLFVVDVDLTPAGTKDNLFQNTLRGHGIQFANDMKVDGELEDALLRGRMLARVEGVPGNGKDGELVYVVAAGQQIDSAIRHLGRSGEVRRLRFDMSIKPAELNVFQKLRAADARDRERQAEFVEGMGRARRLLFNLAVLSPAARQMGGQGLVGNPLGDPEALLPGDKPSVGDEKAAPGANEIFEVLFIVRKSS
jgi:anti-sigma factor RsiW